MTKTRIKLIAATAAAALLAVPAAAGAAEKAPKPSIDYYLTKTDLSVKLKMTLRDCPKAAGEYPDIAAEWIVEAEGAADTDNPVKVDISNGFLVKRSTAFTFNPDGTLAAFNAKAEGQGGVVLESVLKTLGVAARLAAGSPIQVYGESDTPKPPAMKNPHACSLAARENLAKLSANKDAIRQIEDLVLPGKATSAQIAELDTLRKRQPGLQKKLILTLPVTLTDRGVNIGMTGTVRTKEKLGKWFAQDGSEEAKGGTLFDLANLDGVEGYVVDVEAAGPTPAGGENPSKVEPQRLLVYRRPVPAIVKVTDAGCTENDTTKCTETVDTETPLLIAQWGKIETLKIGAGSIFGSREAKAKFDEFGTPLELSYGSESGAEGIASAIGTAGDTATSVADADIGALERAVKREELRKKLADLKSDTTGE